MYPRWHARARPHGRNRIVLDRWRRAEPRYRIRRALGWATAALITLGVLTGLSDSVTGDTLLPYR